MPAPYWVLLDCAEMFGLTVWFCLTSTHHICMCEREPELYKGTECHVCDGVWGCETDRSSCLTHIQVCHPQPDGVENAYSDV